MGLSRLGNVVRPAQDGVVGAGGNDGGSSCFWRTTDWLFALPAVVCGFGHSLLFPAVVSIGGWFPIQYRGSGTTLVLGFTDWDGARRTDSGNADRPRQPGRRDRRLFVDVHRGGGDRRCRGSLLCRHGGADPDHDPHHCPAEMPASEMIEVESDEGDMIAVPGRGSSSRLTTLPLSKG